MDRLLYRGNPFKFTVIREHSKYERQGDLASCTQALLYDINLVVDAFFTFAILFKYYFRCELEKPGSNFKLFLIILHVLDNNSPLPPEFFFRRFWDIA